MGRRVRRLVLLATAATLAAVLLAVAAIEAWVRASWDHRRGTPGFFLSDASRGQRLAPGYNGWFAGVPVQINSLGFRDPREYSVEKPAGTFRILVLGDSVTFGHGARFETTYPYLLEQRLMEWRGDVQWEVWNLGVPGYNTRQELTYLHEIGARVAPDLVIVGFYPNDFTGNNASGAAGRTARVTSAVLRTIQQWFYSYEFYKRAYLTARWKLFTEDSDRQRIEHLATEADLLQKGEVDDRTQMLTNVDHFDDEDVRNFVCVGMPRVDPEAPGELRARIRAKTPELASWLDAVREFQQLAREGKYRIVFFVNGAPATCPDRDRFYDGGSLADDATVMQVLGEGTPAVSSAPAFLHYRPSQMPLANGHSVGNSNRVKADVLFDFLRSAVFSPQSSVRSPQ